MRPGIPIDILITIVVSVIGSSGFWAFLTHLLSKRSAANRMLLGLAHDRIISLSELYLRRGYVTPEEFENLHDYLYTPYKQMGGNGTAEMMVNKVKQLPCKED